MSDSDTECLNIKTECQKLFYWYSPQRIFCRICQNAPISQLSQQMASSVEIQKGQQEEDLLMLELDNCNFSRPQYTLPRVDP